MRQVQIIHAEVVDETQMFTLLEVSEKLLIPEDLIIEMHGYGLFEFDEQKRILTSQAFHRIQKALRLHQDLEINLPGVVLALELLDELEELREFREIWTSQKGS